MCFNHIRSYLVGFLIVKKTVKKVIAEPILGCDESVVEVLTHHFPDRDLCE